MKTFKDLDFEESPWRNTSIQAYIRFDNGWVMSVKQLSEYYYIRVWEGRMEIEDYKQYYIYHKERITDLMLNVQNRRYLEPTIKTLYAKRVGTYVEVYNKKGKLKAIYPNTGYRPTKSTKTVTLNCFKWRLKWLKD